MEIIIEEKFIDRAARVAMLLFAAILLPASLLASAPANYAMVIISGSFGYFLPFFIQTGMRNPLRMKASWRMRCPCFMATWQCLYPIPFVALLVEETSAPTVHLLSLLISGGIAYLSHYLDARYDAKYSIEDLAKTKCCRAFIALFLGVAGHFLSHCPECGALSGALEAVSFGELFVTVLFLYREMKCAVKKDF